MDQKKNPIVIICMALILFIVVVTFAASFRSFANIGGSRRHLDYEDFSAGWFDEKGREISLSRLSENCIIQKEIPSLDSEKVLSFNAKNVEIDVYIEDTCIFHQEKVEDPFLKAIYSKTAGSIFVEIPIPEDYSGKTLSIDIKNPYGSGSGCKIINMYLGEGTAIVKHNASIQLGAFCFSILIVFVGVVCLLLYLPMKKRQIADSSMLYLGMSAFVFGMTMVTDSKLLPLIVGHATLYYNISQLFMAIMSIPLLLFFEQFYEDVNKKFTRALCIINIVDFIGIVILNACGIIDYHDNKYFVLLLFVISILYIGYITIKQIIKRDKGNIFHHIGMLMIVFTVIFDVILLQKGTIGTYYFTRFGIAGFACMEVVQILWRYMENYQEAVKSQFLRRLAYYDGLTDTLNRTSFMEDMEKLENKEHSDLLIAMLDINDLKYVNDTFGHADGDELIIHVAEALKNAFGEIGKCYRIGGDEFVFISGCKTPEQKFLEACNTMNAQIKEYDRQSKYPVSVAMGYAVMNENYGSVNDLLKDADKKMYENKHMLKSKSSKES